MRQLTKPTESTTPRVDPDGLWVMMTCQSRSIDYNKCTSLVQDVSRVGEAGGGPEAYGNSLYHPLET